MPRPRLRLDKEVEYAENWTPNWSGDTFGKLKTPIPGIVSLWIHKRKHAHVTFGN